MIGFLKTIYDFIIIDAPPLDSASELIAISKQVDGLIVTVRAGVTSKGALSDLVTGLETGKVPITGVVFNGVIPGSTGSYGYGYGKRYGTYASRYTSFGDSRDRKKMKGLSKRRSSGWYQRKYKRDLALRGRSESMLFDPILAFGPDAANKSLETWTGISMYTSGMKSIKDTDTTSNKAETPSAKILADEKGVVVEQPLSVMDSLASIESDEEAKGKK
jgi:hypothetical protein